MKSCLLSPPPLSPSPGHLQPRSAGQGSPGPAHRKSHTCTRAQSQPCHRGWRHARRSCPWGGRCQPNSPRGTNCPGGRGQPCLPAPPWLWWHMQVRPTLRSLRPPPSGASSVRPPGPLLFPERCGTFQLCPRSTPPKLPPPPCLCGPLASFNSRVYRVPPWPPGWNDFEVTSMPHPGLLLGADAPHAQAQALPSDAKVQLCP